MKKILRRILPNPLDRLLQQAKKQAKTKFLLAWNRGLGDIPLGLYAIVEQIRKYVPDAQVTFLTRKDLEEGFCLLEGVKVLVEDRWNRKDAYDVQESLRRLNIDPRQFDLILEKPDPTYWVAWQKKRVIPHLYWNASWDLLSRPYQSLSRKGIAVHVQTETNYALWRNWPEKHWKELFSKAPGPFFLFGLRNSPQFEGENIVDLRGKTSILSMLSIIKNCCHTLIAPDCGVLALVYYLNISCPLRVISLWSDPTQGVLKQGVASPNALLEHFPLIAPDKNLVNLRVDEVMEKL
ncbi:MAG: hypothetical protein JW769_05395 [Parachlamydiales bacterium]|nr:hypothetical protein [Parachlamydiales bacterium]